MRKIFASLFFVFAFAYCLFATVSGTSLSGSENGTILAFDTLAANYGNSLATAVSTLGSTPRTIIVDTNTTCSTAITVPATIVLQFINNAKIIKSSSCTIAFQGDGIAEPEPVNRAPVFSGFAVSDITFTGTVYPLRLSTALWDDAQLSARILRAQAAVTGQKATVVAYPGDINARIDMTPGVSIHLTRGTYTNSITGADNYTFVLANNTELYGDGQGQTYLQENADSARMISVSGFVAYPFSGANNDIAVRDLTLSGNLSTAVNSSASAINLGNTKSGSVRRVTCDRTHGFCAFVGGFTTNNTQAENVWITDNLAIGLQTQYFGTVGGHNIHFSKNTLILDTTGSTTIAAFDIEPNADTEGSDNIHITDNIIDGRLAYGYWNGITIQKGYSANVRNIRVSGNTIIGEDLTIISFRDNEINTSTDTFTVYSHGFHKGQRVLISGNTLPAGLTGPFYYGYVIYVSQDAFKIAATKADALAKIPVDITGTGSNDYNVRSLTTLSNGIQVFNTTGGVIENNYVQGAGQSAFDLEGSYQTVVKNNTAKNCSNGIYALGVIQGDIIGNDLLLGTSPIAVSSITEAEYTLQVNTTSGSNIISIYNADSVAPWFFAGLTVRINGVDYVIAKRVGFASYVLTTNAASTLTNTTATIKNWGTKYVRNRSTRVNLLANANSTVISTADRVVSDSFAPAQITSNQNNYNPQTTAYRWNLSSDATRNITGIGLDQAPFYYTMLDGQKHLLLNAGSQNIVLKHQDMNSTAAYRFVCSTGADITLAPGQAADIEYVGGAVNRWYVFKRN